MWIDYLVVDDGVRIGASNTIEMLMEHDFDLVINDRVYRVKTPPAEKPSDVSSNVKSL